MLLVLFIVTPIVILMGVLAKPLIVFLFTEKWVEAVPIFQIICFTGILYPIHMYNLIVLQVMGRSDLFLKLEIIKKVVLAAIIFISFFYGFYALLWGQLIASVISLFINTHYAGKMLAYNFWQQMKDIFPIFIFALIIAFACYGIDSLLSSYQNIVRLIITSFSGVTLYLIIAFLFKFQSIQDIKNLILKK
jgi:teichuronic acid exporter